jgi:hypothetical protein
MPKDLAVLPEPTPGGANLVDPNPMADALVALGGNAPNPDASSRGDGGIITYASRNGVTQSIRSVLAAEDLDFRFLDEGELLQFCRILAVVRGVVVADRHPGDFGALLRAEPERNGADFGVFSQGQR